MRTRSLGFLSFAHQEGDLGFVELQLALSGNAASVTEKDGKMVKQGMAKMVQPET